MLPANFKEDVRELIALARECPESLQDRCLQMLLDDYLKRSSEYKDEHGSSDEAPKSSAAQEESDQAQETAGEGAKTAPGQRDLVQTDLHLKAKKFLLQHELTLDDINQLFFIEDSVIKPLYDDLKTTKASETQIRIGLLQALRTGIKDGEFQFSGEEVRTECQERKAYDKNNFGANFKNSAALFVGFDKYEKSSPVLKLTDAGKQRLAETIKELK